MNEQNPFKLLSSQTVYQNPWMTVREDSVLRPSGEKGIFGVVTIQPGISVLPLDKEGNVYLIDEYQYALEQQMLLAMSGGIDSGEEPLEAAQRELREESGIKAESWVALGVVDSLTMLVNCRLHLFLAQDLSFGTAGEEEQQTIKLVKLPFEQAYNMALDNQISHATAIALLMRTKEYLDRTHD